MMDLRSLRIPLLLWLLVALTGAALPQMASAETTRTVDSEITISCDVPGQIIEAGETATFDLTISNSGAEINRAMWYETYEVSKYDWDIRFMDGTREINLLALAPGEKKDITVLVETNSETPPDRYAIRLQIGDGYYWLYVTISKTHAGEKGTLELAVVDKDGEKIKSAVVTVLEGNRIIDTVMSTADGSVSAQIDQGIYTVTIGKSGYSTVEKDDVKIKGGITTDIGTVMLDKALYAAEVTVRSPVITTTASANPTYDISIQNSGKSDDTYRLSVEGSPEEWYFRFRESGAQTVDLSEIFLKSGDEKTLTLEGIPPHGVDTGDYSFALTVDSSQAIYTKNLTVKIRGDYDLNVYASQYQYDVTKGDHLSFDLTLANGGTAGSLTNVKVSVSAPDGWTADIDPATIAGIQPGTQKVVTLNVAPPGNIVASEYKITVSVASDQIEQSDDFRVVVHEQSYIGIIGVIVVIAIGAGVFFMFRKYSRR